MSGLHRRKPLSPGSQLHLVKVVIVCVQTRFYSIPFILEPLGSVLNGLRKLMSRFGWGYQLEWISLARSNLLAD